MSHFASSYFSANYFNTYFKARGVVIPTPPISIPGGGSGGDGTFPELLIADYTSLDAMGLSQEDKDVLELLIAFVLTR